MTRWATAQLLPDGPTTTTIGPVPMWHYEDAIGPASWCDDCQEHHTEQERVEDPPLESAASWPPGAGDWKSYDRVRFTAEDGAAVTVKLPSALTFAPSDTLTIDTPTFLHV